MITTRLYPGQQEAIDIIAVLDDDTRQRLYHAEKAYDEATDQWLQDWASDYADERFDIDDESEEWDAAHDEGMDLAQESEEWLPASDALLAEIAAQYSVTVDLLGHAVTLMNNHEGWSLVEQRRCDLGLVTHEDKVNKAVETLAGLPLAMLIAALDVGEAVNEIADDELDEDDIATLAEHFRLDGPTIEAAGVVLKAGQENAVLDQHEAFTDRVMDRRVMPFLANLDAVTCQNTFSVQVAFREALQTWRDGWTAPSDDCARIEDDPAYHAFVTATEEAIEATHGVTIEQMMHADAINHWIGRVGFDEVRVRFAERLIAEGRDPADPDVAHARAALSELPAADGMVDRMIAAARAYGKAEATWCLDWTFDERNADTNARPEDQPAYAAFTERLLASIVAEHGVTVAQLKHAVNTGTQYIGHDNILARRWKRLAPRVAAAIAALPAPTKRY